MQLVRLVYVSRKPQHIAEEAITNILSFARSYNIKNNITGILCFNRKYFLQCLEGNRLTVNQTFQRILRDSRHEGVLMLDYREIERREFAQWNMGYVPDSTRTHDIHLKYSSGTEFEPYELSGQSAHLLMLELKNVLPMSE
ncbi:BLUF domain-containing protein [Thalassotalea sp. M1531]|uniref:BLUF domain-containing protein n=1 Tax=Thalassotalea algicola TaxID=2716224 RepID=A0A7Y0LF30_9GAMM|nr:BLUF domain-containing protein [Thalassotalea algicola]NMP32521.1 BLUF domain-containing protein [Thalassotalea algicola]